MNRILLFAFVLVSIFSSVALAQNTRDFPVGNFNQLHLQGNLQVELIQGEKAKVQVVGNAGEIDEISLTSSSRELTIKTKHLDLFDNGSQRNKKLIKVLITYQSLTLLHASRGATVKVKSIVKADDFVLKAYSGSLVELGVTATSMQIEVSEGAMATISGKVTVQTTKVSTGGQLNATNLEAEVVNIRTNTGGISNISVSKSIDASAGTGGVIKYKGNPSKREVNTSLGGAISEL